MTTFRFSKVALFSHALLSERDMNLFPNLNPKQEWSVWPLKGWAIPNLIQFNVWILPKNELFNIQFNIALPKIQLKKVAVSIQRIIQFNSQGIIDTGLTGIVPKSAQKVSKIDDKGIFSSKMANIDPKYDSFIHFTIKFNSISISSGICNSKNYSITFFSLYI